MTDPDNAPENTDPKKNDDTAEQPTAAAEESDGTELSDEELGDAAGGTYTNLGMGNDLDPSQEMPNGTELSDEN